MYKFPPSVIIVTMRRLLLSFDSSILALAEQVLHDLGRATISVAPTPGFSSVSDSRGLPLPTVEVVFADDIQQPGNYVLSLL